MFEIESKDINEITINVGQKSITIDVAESTVNAGLEVGEIQGPGEFEIGDAAIRGIATEKGTIYDVTIGNTHVGIIGGIETGLDDLGIADILCTSSVRAIRELEPKMVIAMGNVDGMVTELKSTARTEKKVKIKSGDSLPATLDVVVLN
ncbi:MAG: hypothetical protein Q4E47_02510 [Candidatus Saccharibacteria bacterium]|nr:hypothetical protein [Candidatus Saccharibacteria bacterium]